MPRRYEVHPNLEAIAEAGATEMARVLRQAVADRGRCVMALSGRPAAAAMCRALTDPARGGDLPWGSVWVFATDQRVAETPGAPRPLAALREALLDLVPIPPAQVLVDESPERQDVAAHTSAALAELAGENGLDLVLLQMGEHGRVASIFPGTEALYTTRRGTVCQWIPGVDEWRVTLTMTELNRARHVVVIASGADNAAAMKDLASGVSGTPAARLKPAGQLVWLMDEAAAGGMDASADNGTISFTAADAALGRAADSDQAVALKRAAGEAALAEVQSGMRMGLGTGSTVRWVIEGLARELAAGNLRDVVAVPTSAATAGMAADLGIPLAALDDTHQLDLAIDGADEIDPALNLVKGGGGALLREKIVASCARRFVVVADASKAVDRLLSTFPLPVEVDPFGWSTHVAAIAELGGQAQLRRRNGEPFRTDGGHYVLDCHFAPASGQGGQSPPLDLAALERALRARPGVIETGLFLNMVHRAYVADASGVIVRERA